MKKEDTIIKILGEHTKILESHTKKLEDHDERFDRIFKKLDEHDKRFDRIFKKLDNHDKTFDRIINKLLKHDDDIADIRKNMATKTDIRQIMNTLDTLVGLYKKKDLELTMITHGTRRLDDRVVILEKDMTRVKPLVGLSA